MPSRWARCGRTLHQDVCPRIPSSPALDLAFLSLHWALLGSSIDRHLISADVIYKVFIEHPIYASLDMHNHAPRA